MHSFMDDVDNDLIKIIYRTVSAVSTGGIAIKGAVDISLFLRVFFLRYRVADQF